MKKFILILAACVTGSAWADDATVKQLQFEYQSKGAGPAFSAANGKAMFERKNPADGEERSCTTCHTNDLRAVGKQANTGKAIEPLAVSANPKRLTRPAEVEKWFGRNCKWTLGRACTPQEKGDFIAYIASQ